MGRLSLGGESLCLCLEFRFVGPLFFTLENSRHSGVSETLSPPSLVRNDGNKGVDVSPAVGTRSFPKTGLRCSISGLPKFFEIAAPVYGLVTLGLQCIPGPKVVRRLLKVHRSTCR